MCQEPDLGFAMAVDKQVNLQLEPLLEGRGCVRVCGGGCSGAVERVTDDQYLGSCPLRAAPKAPGQLTMGHGHSQSIRPSPPRLNEG